METQLMFPEDSTLATFLMTTILSVPNIQFTISKRCLIHVNALTGKSTLTSVPSSKDTRQVMTDLASPDAGMCVVARWASRRRVFSACFRMERRPSVLRRKLSMLEERGGYTARPGQETQRVRNVQTSFINVLFLDFIHFFTDKQRKQVDERSLWFTIVVLH